MKKKLAALLLTVAALLVTLAAGPVFAGNHHDGPGRHRHPKVSITNPADGTTFESGDAISFEGTASDKEDGDLTASLAWTSSVDGWIGAAGSFSTTLSDGDHTITASVTDSGGKTGSEFITIYVGTQSVGTPRSLELTVTLDREPPTGSDWPVYYDGETVKIRADVADDKGPAKGVTVYYEFTTAYGGLLECTIRTQNKAGYTVCSYRVNAQQHGEGEYKVVVTASKTGYKTPVPVTVKFNVALLRE